MSYKYTALIIEPREHKALEFVLNNFINNLNYDEWCFIILHGNLNKQFVLDIINNIDILRENNHHINNATNNKINLYNMNIDNINIDEYNSLLKNHNLYDIINTDKFLIFQTDTLILQEHKHIIYDFLEYDYVGAPWKISTNEWLDGNIGNGGLSLRSKKHMVEIIEKVNNSSINEDIYFSMQTIVSLNKPTYEKAMEFSIETHFNEISFGVHKPWKYMNEDEWNYLTNRYPELITLQQLNIE